MPISDSDTPISTALGNSSSTASSSSTLVDPPATEMPPEPLLTTDASSSSSSSSSFSSCASSSSIASSERVSAWQCLKCRAANDHLFYKCSSCSAISHRPPCALFGTFSSLPSSLIALLASLMNDIPPMDKKTMSGRCQRETTRMEHFLEENFDFINLRSQYFVQGVRAFQLRRPVTDEKREDDELVLMKDTFRPENEGVKEEAVPVWSCSMKEIRQWQKSFRCYTPSDVYSQDDKSLSLLCRSLQGGSVPGDEAFRMKYVVRMSQTPIICTFNGRVYPRATGRADDSLIYLQSVSGIDFAGRIHDYEDLKVYMKNVRKVYDHDFFGKPYIIGGRDLVITGKPVQLDEEKLFADLQKMFRIRLFAADSEGISIVIETGIGLGVFSGDSVGIGEKVRSFSATACRRVLEADAARLGSVKLLIFSLPAFRAKDNIHYYIEAFNGYSGTIPVLIADQDMHALALCCAANGWKTSELNPADSHGVFGEYWQNRGPGTEEKLALTTLGILTQHHVVNPEVTDMKNYRLLDLNKYNGRKEIEKDKTESKQ